MARVSFDGGQLNWTRDAAKGALDRRARWAPTVGAMLWIKQEWQAYSEPVSSTAVQAVSGGRGSALPLVGREQVLADLAAALDQARASRGGLVLITGEPGIGKTRLAEEAVERAGDFSTVWCWCAADAASGSFRPWLQIARELASTTADAQAIELRPSGADPDAARWQFFEAICERVRLAARRRPVLLVLDDVHDAQESSLWLLTHLVPTLRASPALVLATARDGERAWHGHIDVRSALLRQATAIHLGPLREPHIAQLIQHQAHSPSLAHKVLVRTGGNPLLVTELVRALRDDANAASSALPESIRAITAARISGLESTSQRLLVAAAVLGARFGLDALANVAEIDASAMRSALADAELTGLVDISEPAAGRFIHELTRDAVYERIAPAERLVWHERSATALVALAERGRDVAPAEITHHLLRAGPDAALRAANYAQQAGDRSAQLLAFEDAVSWYEQTLQAFAATDHDPGRQASVHLALAEARVGCGDRTGARETFLQAAALARSASLPTVLAGAALGLGSGPAGFEVGLLDQQQLDLLEG
jgi:predicted ATPase